MEAIKVNNIYKNYRLKDRELVVLKGLSLTIPLNKISVILGKSGGGKTTLLRILSNLEKPDAGNVTYPKDYQSSYVFQEPRLMPWLTIKENIAFAYTKDNYDESYLNTLIDMVGLSDFKEAYPSQLSGGMKQRATLARALAIQPNLIYMDEPFAALDYFTRANMQDELLKLYQETKCGILFVTHNIDEAIRLAHQIIILDEGWAKNIYELADDLATRDILTSPYIALKKEILTSLNERKY